MRNEPAYAIEGNALVHGAVRPHRLVVCRDRIDHDRSSVPVWWLASDEILMPAFHDHHTHLVGTCRPRQGPDLDGIASRPEALAEVARWLQTHPGSAPVLGEGWDESLWEEPRPLERTDLDAIDPSRPIALRRVCGHIAVANRAAWSILRPEGIEADPARGILKESLALGLSRRWPVPFEDLVEGARRGQEEAARLGVTGIDEMGRLETYRAFLRLDEEERLFLEVRHFFPLGEGGEIDEALRLGESRSGSVHIAGWKGFLDGSLGARTAAVDPPYGSCGGVGMLLWETDRLADAVREGSRTGYSIALHAIGLRAIRQGLAVLEKASPPSGGGMHRIEHAEEADGESFERGRTAAIAWSMQPNFTVRWQGEKGMYGSILGEPRRRSLNRYRSALANGPILFGSDTMPLGPLYGVVGALEHPDPAERLTATEALRAYMPGGLGGAVGERLDPGRRADLVVVRVGRRDLDRSLRERSARVVWTAAAGRTVWCDPQASAPASLRKGDA